MDIRPTHEKGEYMRQRVKSAFHIILTVAFILTVKSLQAGDITLTLVNASTNQKIYEMVDGININLADVGQQLNVQAEFSMNVASVHFEFDGTDFRTENGAPYAMAGEQAGDFSPWTPELGSHTLKVTAYDDTGSEISQKTISFTVVESSEEIPLMLINAFTDKDILLLANNTTINLNDS
jgi:hypothetical protein